MSTKVATAFLDRVQKSGLVSEEKLAQLRQELETEGVDVSDPSALSRALVERDEITQWQADKLLQGKHKGFFLGSYRLERPLGKGGMGAVFLARHVVMRRRCAIKVLPQTQIQKHSSVLDRFMLEAQAVASLDHQNIVRAYDVSKEVKDGKEIHFLVMEYVEGQDAQQMVQEHGVVDYVKAAEIIR
jgi:serine/threonine-protein kinase